MIKVKKKYSFTDAYKTYLDNKKSNEIKEVTVYSIGTLNPLEYNDETKGFTIGEALKFPKEIRDHHRIGMVKRQIKKKNN